MKNVILSKPTNVKIICAKNNYEGLGCLYLPLLANNILERGWIMCLSFKWLLWQAALFLTFLSNI